MSARRQLERRLRGTAEAIGSVTDQLDAVFAVADAIAVHLERGRRLYTCGNGGSAAQAMHLAEELVGRYRGDRPPLPAVCLNADATALTCIANDYGFEHVFARMCEGLLTPDDLLVVLSTSGTSPNLVNALDVARRRDVTAIGLLGRDGGDCLSRCHRAIVIPGPDAAHIQEAHLVVIHLICEVVEGRAG